MCSGLLTVHTLRTIPTHFQMKKYHMDTYYIGTN